MYFIVFNSPSFYFSENFYVHLRSIADEKKDMVCYYLQSALKLQISSFILLYKIIIETVDNHALLCIISKQIDKINTIYYILEIAIRN